MGGAQLGDRDGEAVDELEHRTGVALTGVGHADPREREGACGAHVLETHFLGAGDGDDRACCRLREQEREEVDAVALGDLVEPYPRTHAAAQARLGQGLCEPALGEVVRGVDHAVARGVDEDVGELLLRVRPELRGHAAEVAVDDIGPRRAVELLGGGAEQVDRLAGVLPARRGGTGDVVEHAEHADHRGRVDGDAAGLVVQRHVAAGDGDAELLAAGGQTLDGLRELPHDLRVLRRAEVEAVGDGERPGARGGDVAVCLGERELRPACGVEVAVAAVGVGRDRHAEPGLLVDPDDTGVVGERECGVALHVAVVLVRHPGLRGEVGGAEESQQRGAQLLVRLRAGEAGGGDGVRAGGLRPRGLVVGALVDRAVVGHGARRHVDDDVAVPFDDEPAGVGDLAEHARLDVPPGGDREELLELLRGDDRHHPLLGFAHEDLLRRERGVAQQHVVEGDVHAALAVGGELGGGAGDAGGAEVLDALDDLGGEQLEAALDEDLLRERVAHLHGRALGRLGVVEGLRGEDRGAADPVAAGARPEQHDLVAHARSVGQSDVVVAQHSHGERVDERVALVDGVEDDLAADVRQAQAVAVATHPGDDAVDHAGGVRVVDRAEAQLVHDRDGARPHGDDVAHDAAHAGGRALVGLDVGGVVVALDLEGHRPVVADVDDAGVLADPHEQVLLHVVGDVVAELAQVDLGGLVGAVLGPHDGVHRELRRGGAPAEDLPDARVLVLLEPELRERLLDIGVLGGEVDRLLDLLVRRCRVRVRHDPGVVLS